MHQLPKHATTRCFPVKPFIAKAFKSSLEARGHPTGAKNSNNCAIKGVALLTCPFISCPPDLSCNIPEIPNNNSCVLIKPWHSWNMLKDIQIKPQITLSLGQWGTLQEPEMRFWKMSPEAISRAAIFSCKSSISTLGGLQTGNKGNRAGHQLKNASPERTLQSSRYEKTGMAWHGCMLEMHAPSASKQI